MRMNVCGLLAHQNSSLWQRIPKQYFKRQDRRYFNKFLPPVDLNLFIDPQKVLTTSSDALYEHTDDGLFIEPVVGRRNPGIGLILLNLDRKPGDGARGILTVKDLKTAWKSRTFKRKLVESLFKEKKHPSDPTSPASDTASSDRRAALTDEQRNEYPTRLQSSMLQYYASGPLSQRAINALYQRLRNHEVNTLQRVVALTSVREAVFSEGLSLLEWLLMAEASQAVGELQPYALETLSNFAELVWVVHTFQKPLLSFANGKLENEGASLCFLANHSAVYKSSNASFTFPAYGLAPIGGISHLLSRVPSNIGFYLGLTGHTISGVELLQCKLANYWMSPEAIPFLELSCASQLVVTEHDAKELIREHFLVPQDHKTSSVLREWEHPINWVFSSTTLQGVISRLQTLIERRERSLSFPRLSASALSEWATDTLTSITRAPLLSQLATFELLHRTRLFRYSLLKKSDLSLEDWHRLQNTDNLHPQNVLEVSKKQLVEEIDQQTLAFALSSEIRVMSRLLMMPDTLESLRWAASQFWCIHETDNRYWPHIPQYKDFDNIPNGFLDELFQPLDAKYAFGEFRASQRSPLPLSQHPWLRKVHPDHNPRTGLDYDPLSDNAERWEVQRFDDARKHLVKMLTSKQRPERLFDWA